MSKKKSLIRRISKSEVFDLNGIGEKPDNPLEYRHGLYTIRKIDGTSADRFAITSKNLIPGYIHADNGVKTLDLTDGKPKLIINLKASYYHFLLDDVAGVIEAIEQYPDHELIIDLSQVTGIMQDEEKSFTFYFEFLEMLKFHGVPHKVVCLIDFDVVYIDNFYYIDYDYVSSFRADKIYKYFLPYVNDKTIVPHRSVYVSRKKQDVERPHQQTIEEIDFVYDGLRIDDEIALEQLFASMGFEITYPEDFIGFDEQVDFFYSVKTIASLTSSGLSNSIFMQPGGTVIEIVSPIIANPISPEGEKEALQKGIHNFYKDISFLKQHLYIAIQNPDFKFKDVKNAIDSNSKFKQFLTVNNE